MTYSPSATEADICASNSQRLPVWRKRCLDTVAAVSQLLKALAVGLASLRDASAQTIVGAAKQICKVQVQFVISPSQRTLRPSQSDLVLTLERPAAGKFTGMT